MKKLKLLAVVLMMGAAGGALAACGSSAPADADVYTGYRVDSEAGYDELLFPVCQDLVLVGNNYVYNESTLLCHTLAKSIVATHLYEFKGTFTVKSENKEENTKTIELSKPTWGIDKGTGTTLADDPELMEKFVISTTVTLDTAKFTATFTLA